MLVGSCQPCSRGTELRKCHSVVIWPVNPTILEWKLDKIEDWLQGVILVAEWNLPPSVSSQYFVGHAVFICYNIVSCFMFCVFTIDPSFDGSIHIPALSVLTMDTRELLCHLFFIKLLAQSSFGHWFYLSSSSNLFCWFHSVFWMSSHWKISAL